MNAPVQPPNGQPPKSSQRRLVVATSFRPFTGGPNDEIQRLFLEGLKKQTHENLVLQVTQFGEPGVLEALRQSGVEFEYHPVQPEGCRYSQSIVLENAASRGLPSGQGLIAWTTSDVWMPPDFLSSVARHVGPRECATTFPMRRFRSPQDFTAGKAPAWFATGLDFVCFGGGILAPGSDALKALRRFPNRDWGCFEWFLSAMGIAYADRMINLFPITITRIENPQDSRPDLAEDSVRSERENRRQLERFAAQVGVDPASGRLMRAYRRVDVPMGSADHWVLLQTRMRLRFRAMRQGLGIGLGGGIPSGGEAA